MGEFLLVVFGLTLRCYAAGNVCDPVLLYIHGNLGSGIWFDRVMDVPGYRTIAPDLPNFGMSEASGDYSMAGYARFITGIIEELGVDCCTVVGHSLGGVVAMELAAERPDLIERLLLVSPGPIEGLKTPKSHYSAIERYKTDRDFLKAGLRSVVPFLEDEAFLDCLTDMAFRMDRGAFIAHVEELEKADLRDRLGTLPFPATLLRGDGDVIISEDMAVRTAEHIGAEYLTLTGCGHSPMVEKPVEFMDILESFLEKEP